MSACAVVGQFSETINTNRPGQSNGSSTVGQHVFQMESGLLYNKSSTDDQSLSIGNLGTTLRYGFLEKVEAYASFGYTTIEAIFEQHNDHLSGLSGSELGLIWHAMDENRFVPSVALQAGSMPPWVSSDFKSEDPGARLAILLGKSLSDSFSLTSNLSSVWDGITSKPATAYTLSLSFAVHERIGTFVELYGDIDPGSSRLDGGMTYMLSSNRQVDCWVGYQGLQDGEDWFVGLGYSWRILRSKS